MKKLLFLAAALSAACAASAQGYYTDAYNPDITRHTGRIAAQRAEFILPEVNGYNVYKADLHTHSVYSDGDCTPEFRVREAWYDGLFSQMPIRNAPMTAPGMEPIPPNTAATKARC